MIDYSTNDIAIMAGVKHQTVLNWVREGWIVPYKFDEYGHARFSAEQYDAIYNALPLPPMRERKDFLQQFSCNNPIRETMAVIEHPPISSPESKQGKELQAILQKSNALLFRSLENGKVDLNNIVEVDMAVRDYFQFCYDNAIMPSYRRLANWLGYSFQALVLKEKKGTDVGKYLEMIKDAVKDNLEQAALSNSVNNISAIFLLKAQYGYVEQQHILVETTNSEPKTPEEIAEFIDADIVED